MKPLFYICEQNDLAELRSSNLVVGHPYVSARAHVEWDEDKLCMRLHMDVTVSAKTEDHCWVRVDKTATLHGDSGPVLRRHAEMALSEYIATATARVKAACNG